MVLILEEEQRVRSPELDPQLSPVLEVEIIGFGNYFLNKGGPQRNQAEKELTESIAIINIGKTSRRFLIWDFLISSRVKK